MSSESKAISIGTIKEKSGERKDGSGSFSFLEIDLKQAVDVSIKGEKVSFSQYETKNGTFANKRITITPVDVALDRLAKSVEEGKLTAELADDIRARYKEQDVLYTLSIASKSIILLLLFSSSLCLHA